MNGKNVFNLALYAHVSFRFAVNNNLLKIANGAENYLPRHIP
jgi:hypothetical protein